jgi:hypothetical protein
MVILQENQLLSFVDKIVSTFKALAWVKKANFKFLIKALKIKLLYLRL